jgi:hypothetical protein
MATGFGALRHQHVRLRRNGLARGFEALHLQDELGAGTADLLGERRRISEREHHCSGLVREREVEELGALGEAPGDEADPDARIASKLELRADPFRVAVAGADEAQAAGRRYRGGERAAGDESHRRQYQGLFDAEDVHAVRPARSLSFCALMSARMRSQSASESLSSSAK